MWVYYCGGRGNFAMEGEDGNEINIRNERRSEYLIADRSMG